MPLTPEEVRDRRFPRTRLRPGYVPEDVGSLLERAAATLAAARGGPAAPDPVTARDVERWLFRVTRLTSGYDMHEVDGFLDAVVAELRSAEERAPEAFRRPDRRAPEAGLRPEDVRAKRFTTTWLRSGYDELEVDDFLDRVEMTFEALLAEHRDPRLLTAAEVRAARFSVVRMRPGYDADEVTAFLDVIAAELQRRGRG
ncbi:DivIVA domain-containing protein [Marinactinospora thermotolerans]|uniref:Cell wall synthesis protein Wag31 n=1 Tax=Marinactinospora thermotolerans DSM 45154 TaxID=1122192 RepID=A0A1T4N404_9ACTN|nr:DivIVA domain-containing protein [Marinactinospora thermotolerans]SJZ74090.1 DivIVA domain-containing protein [Marinactinospora thermotolerans DSM 45154]